MAVSRESLNYSEEASRKAIFSLGPPQENSQSIPVILPEVMNEQAESAVRGRYRDSLGCLITLEAVELARSTMVPGEYVNEIRPMVHSGNLPESFNLYMARNGGYADQSASEISANYATVEDINKKHWKKAKEYLDLRKTRSERIMEMGTPINFSSNEASAVDQAKNESEPMAADQ